VVRDEYEAEAVRDAATAMLTAATLRWVNDLRVRLGLWRLSALMPGRPGCSAACPVAESVAVGLGEPVSVCSTHVAVGVRGFWRTTPPVQLWIERYDLDPEFRARLEARETAGVA
jgi:hypothetical protein